MFNPLQAASENSAFWQFFITGLQEEIQDQFRKEEKRLQMEACELSPEDPQFFEKLMRVGPGARVFFRRYPFYLCLSFHPFLHELVRKELIRFIAEFQATTDQVRVAANIPATTWREEEYDHDLAELVSRSTPLLPKQVSTTVLAQQVMAAHEIRQNAAKSTPQQMG